jgi:3-phenylpropionate/cinnamic acid dioxygenase small subunit
VSQATLDARANIWTFLIEEASALDEHRHDDWLGLLTEDFVYEMPVPRSQEDPGRSPYDSPNFLAHESKSF